MNVEILQDESRINLKKQVEDFLKEIGDRFVSLSQSESSYWQTDDDLRAGGMNLTNVTITILYKD